MKTLLILLSGMIVGFGAAWFLGGNKKDDNQGIVKERTDKKKENQGRVLEYIQDKEKFTNDEIEKLLGVSHSTAFRYLEEFEKEGIIKQIGESGSGVYYEKA
jgi:predicted HTH transcriptional regulator